MAKNTTSQSETWIPKILLHLQITKNWFICTYLCLRWILKKYFSKYNKHLKLSTRSNTANSPNGTAHSGTFGCTFFWPWYFRYRTLFPNHWRFNQVQNLNKNESAQFVLNSFELVWTGSNWFRRLFFLWFKVVVRFGPFDTGHVLKYSTNNKNYKVKNWPQTRRLIWVTWFKRHVTYRWNPDHWWA